MTHISLVPRISCQEEQAQGLCHSVSPECTQHAVGVQEAFPTVKSSQLREPASHTHRSSCPVQQIACWDPVLPCACARGTRLSQSGPSVEHLLGGRKHAGPQCDVLGAPHSLLRNAASSRAKGGR